MHCEIVCLRKLEKLYPDENQRKEITTTITAFVTLEPCVMCGYALNIAGSMLINSGIPRVIFGAANDKFGGTNEKFDTSKLQPNPYYTRGGLKKEEAIAELVRFYERGNINLPPEKRHRYKKDMARNK